MSLFIVPRRFALALLCFAVQNVNSQVHSRGESYHGAPPQSPSIWNTRSVNDETVRNYQQTAYQRPPVQQSYAYVNTQNTQNRPQQVNRIPTQQTYQPSNYYAKPIPQGQQFANRFQGDDPSVNQQPQQEEFTTRRSKQPGGPAPDLAPPTAIPTRFDDINKRKIVWDPEVAMSTEEFALKLFGTLEYLQEENLMISPYSIHTLLVMIAEGAGGSTYSQLNTTLGLKSPSRTRDYHQYIGLALNKSDADYTFQKFAALIGDENRPVNLDYENIVEKIYDADYIPVKFNDVENTLKTINREVASKTNGQIREALTRDELFKAQLILLSGVHFKGNWKHVFNASLTKRAPFYDIKQERVLGEVQMMFNRGPFAYTAIQDIGAYFLELPYASKSSTNNRNDDPSTYNSDRVSMIVVLPKRGLELFETIDNINKYGMDRLFKELKKVQVEFDEDEVEVHLPKFEVETSINLVTALQNMGITDLFEQSLANLSKINPNYFVSSILHKTKIRVDEKGTEASAVTSSIFANKATPPVFNANRPFLYFIVDKATRLILFAGSYKNPKLL